MPQFAETLGYFSLSNPTPTSSATHPSLMPDIYYRKRLGSSKPLGFAKHVLSPALTTITTLTTLAALTVLALPAPAGAAQTASITAAFKPERLGAPTTIALGFAIAPGPGEQVPSPLTGVSFHYPANIGIATSELGTAACQPAAVEARGPAICPPNSRMGTGSAFVEIPVGGETQTETAAITLLAGPSEGGYLRFLVGASGLSPVIARVLMTSLLLNGTLQLTVPLVSSLPGAPDVSVVKVHVTIGGRLTYYRNTGRRRIAYHPKGVLLPRTCPRGGFRFAATFTFLDGTQASARTTIACPVGGRREIRGRARPGEP